MPRKSRKSSSQAAQSPASSRTPAASSGPIEGSDPRLNCSNCPLGREAREAGDGDPFSKSRGRRIVLAEAVDRLGITEGILRRWEGEGRLEIKGANGERPGVGGPGAKGLAILESAIKALECGREVGIKEGQRAADLGMVLLAPGDPLEIVRGSRELVMRYAAVCRSDVLLEILGLIFGHAAEQVP